MRRLALALLLAASPFTVACQSSSTEPAPAAATGETASPADSPVAYKVLKDELSNGTVEYHVLVADTVKHDDVESLLKYLYRHLMTRGEDPPAGIGGYVYTSEAAYATPPRTPAGSIVKRPSDLGPTFENKLPLEFHQEIEQALGERHDKGWKLAMTWQRDDAQKTMTMTVPHTEPGKDEWAQQLSFNQAMQTFTDAAQALFGNVHELRKLTYVGRWKDQDVVRVELTRADYTALRLSELDDRIGQHHGRIFLSLQQGPHANMSPEKANAAAAKENSALVAKEYKAMLAQLKGKATVSPQLK